MKAAPNESRLKSKDFVMDFVLSDYINRSMAQAEYDKLDDNTFSGRIPVCTGVVAFAASLPDCENELRSVLEEWILVGLKFQHALPIVQGINLNHSLK